MKTRVITAIVALILFLPLLFLGGEYFKYTTYGLGVMAMYEVVKMTLGKSNLPLLVITGFLGITIYNLEMYGVTTNLVILFTIMIMFLAVVVISNHNIKLGQIGVLIFLTTYIYLGFYSLNIVRGLGLDYVLYLLLTIWVTDSMAYIGGMNFGKRKLSPNISPNKSIEGSVIGSLSSILIALAFYFSTNIFSNLYIAIAVTLIVSVVGQFGDLVESAYKRECGVKDSSNILPGHGGIYDRFDSIILAAPCLVLLLSIV